MTIEINLMYVLFYLLFGICYNFIEQQKSLEAMFATPFCRLVVTLIIIVAWPIHALLWLEYWYWKIYWKNHDIPK
jgi:hypothetical protein